MDATISLFEERKNFIKHEENKAIIHWLQPKGNALNLIYDKNLPSSTLEKELSEGFILSYLYYENGVIKYNGTAKMDVLKKILRIKLYFTHTQLEKVLLHI